jgi:FkbM family methyltransferase
MTTQAAYADLPASLPAPNSPSPMTRLASSLVLNYVRRFPVERGKWKLMERASPFIVVPLDPGLYFRASLMSHVDVSLIREGAFEPETIQLFASVLSPGMTVFDLGANVGLYTLWAAHRVGPTGQVHSFEPTPDVAQALKKNISLNGFGQVMVNEAAVSDAPGKTYLSFLQDDPGENTILRGNEANPGVWVPTLTLDEYVAQRGVSSVDVMKIDIEGAEQMALQGGRTFLSAENAPMLFMEANDKTLAFSGSSLKELLDLLGELGYSFYNIETCQLNNGDPWINGIALKPSHWERFPLLQTLDLQLMSA